MAGIEAAPAEAATPGQPFPQPSIAPTQLGPSGLKYDFNLGARLLLPALEKGEWKLEIRDQVAGNLLFSHRNCGAYVSSAKRFYVKFHLRVSLILDEVENEVFVHELDLRDETVIVLFPVGTLGDVLGWFPYAERFGREHRCRLVCAMSDLIIPLLAETYPDVTFVSHSELVSSGIQDRAYATYRLGLFFDDAANLDQPTDFRIVGLHRTAGYILGVDPDESPPRIAVPKGSPHYTDPYVCIAVQASSQAKYWNNPQGWHEVIKFLVASGFRVVCIDQKSVHGAGIVWNHIPHGVEDHTGELPLPDRAHLLANAKFFIGVSSGLSWLAWAVGIPVVLISGFTHPTNEFFTPFRVFNWHACNSCWNDPRERFDHKDFLWCPRHAGTTRQFECSRVITAHQVIGKVKQVLGTLRE